MGARRSPLERLEDMLVSIDEALTVVAKAKNLTTYKKGLILRRALEHCLQNVSEAARHVPRSWTDPTESDDVPWEDIRGISDVLRHEYMNVRDEIIFKAARDYLRPLRKAIVSIKGMQSRRKAVKERR